MTSVAPKARAACRQSSPTGPAPVTSTRVPGPTRALPQAHTPTDSGSISAAASSDRASGTGWANSSWTTTYSQKAPSIGGVPKNRIRGQRLYRPARHCGQVKSGTPGSSETRCPRRCTAGAGPGGDHGPGGLVAEHQRRLHHEVADPPVLVVVHVGAAGPDGGDPYEHLPRAGLGPGPLLQRDLSHPVQHGRAHGVLARGLRSPPRRWGTEDEVVQAILLSGDGAEGEPGDQPAAHGEPGEHHRHDHDRADGGELAPVDAGLGDELGGGDGQRLGVRARRRPRRTRSRSRRRPGRARRW